MTSWRDSASQQAQADFDNLFNSSLPFAVQTLERYGELFPFGTVITASGDVALRAADPRQGDQPNSDEVLALLRDGVSAENQTVRAAAFVADVLIQVSDAIRVELEHSEGFALVIIVPYSKGDTSEAIDLGDMLVQSGSARIWIS